LQIQKPRRDRNRESEVAAFVDTETKEPTEIEKKK
jgi:hypothetical protein